VGGDRPGRRASPGVRIADPTVPGRPSAPDHLSGPVDVCVAVPRLAVDRPFTYLLPADAGAGTGSLVSVPFHGRAVRGWVLGPAVDVPSGRVLPVRTVRSPVRFFDAAILDLLRWVSERYIAPLATVIERSHPPRVVSEEGAGFGSVGGALGGARGGAPVADHALSAPPRAPFVPPPRPESGVDPLRLLEAGVTTWWRPLPEDEVDSCVRTVAACVQRGRRAIVLVPEADPVPATAAAVLETFGDRAVAFMAGDKRQRYRTWLRIHQGAVDVVVGTRPAVFAPVAGLGLLWISREVHPAHREDRSPYYHVREVAMARARLEAAACVLASLCPSAETVAGARAGRVRTVRPPRRAEREAAPLVETAAPEAEDRSPRLAALLKRARSAALIVSRRGYGVARVCRQCSEPAACASCSGPIVVERGSAACGVCGAPGRCAHCGGRSFGVERGGAERIAEWASMIAVAPVEVATADADGPPKGPGAGRVLVGTATTVNDVGPVRLDLVAILDPDRALSRPGLHAGERALATWMESAAWAGPRAAGGRVLAQTRSPGHPAIQALIRWEPVPFLEAEAARRSEAGFPSDHAVFRIAGPADAGLEETLRAAGASSSLATTGPDGTVCLVAVRPRALPEFRRTVLRLSVEGSVVRVEAEPYL
jgi:primosomal protein N' (replication factor Y) (superfamily II helicase)